MAYGIIKVDTVTFTDAGIDKSVSISGLVQNPTFSGNVTATGTVSGNTIQGQTISGVTVTGTTSTFATGSFVSLTGTTIQGTTASYTSGSFTSLTGVTTSGTTANFVSGVFSSQISGATVTGTTASFTSGVFANISGGTYTITSGVFAAGSAASPSISFTSDPDTGLYSPGANQVALSTNGTGRLFVDASGNIGIGGAATSKLTVTGGSLEVTGPTYNYVQVQATGGAVGQLSSNSSNSIELRAVSNHPLLLFTNNTERLRITSAGLVGIGTSSPSQRLHVNGGQTRFSTSSKADSNTYLTLGTTDASNPMELIFGNTTNSYWSIQSVEQGVANRNLVINPSGGNVGIGTTSPGAPLHVQSGSISAPAWSANDVVVAGNTTGNGAFYQSLSDHSGGFGFSTPTTRSYSYIVWTTANMSVKNGGAGDITVENNNVERARIDSSGRLLIGTSSDSGGALLQVNGDRVRIATAKTPASASATGTAGEVCWDTNYIYVCTATNTWKRAALSTW